MSTEKDYIAKLTNLFMQEESISEEVKELKTEIKDAGFDAVGLAAVAKAIVKNKVDDLREKSEAVVRLIEVSRS